MAERDDSHWEGMSASIERGEYTVAGPVELGPAAVTDDATSPPPTTVAELRRLLDHLPPGCRSSSTVARRHSRRSALW